MSRFTSIKWTQSQRCRHIWTNSSLLRSQGEQTKHNPQTNLKENRSQHKRLDSRPDPTFLRSKIRPSRNVQDISIKWM